MKFPEAKSLQVFLTRHGCKVNMTETMAALSLKTKAGVYSTKIVIGVTSYARSFQIEDPSCTGPECFFTGPASGATPGPCTNVSKKALSRNK